MCVSQIWLLLLTALNTSIILPLREQKPGDKCLASAGFTAGETGGGHNPLIADF